MTTLAAVATLCMLHVMVGCATTEQPTEGGTAAADRSSSSAQASVAALHPRAVEQIVRAARSPEAVLRANAVEASAAIPDRALPIVHLAIDDPIAPVRFAALATMGRLRLKSLVPVAEPRLRDDSEPVRAAAMFALYRCGAKVDITPMAKMLMSRRPAMRGNVAMLLGRMGDPSAAPMLHDAALRDGEKFDASSASGALTPGAVSLAISRMQIAEAMVMLGDRTALEPIRAASVFAVSDEVRVLAVQMLGRLGDADMEAALLDMLGTMPPEPGGEPPEVQLAAAEALARLNWTKGLGVALAGAAQPSVTLRQQAAMTLGLYRTDPRAVAALEKLLEDPSQAVRLAAAAAVVGYDPSWKVRAADAR